MKVNHIGIIVVDINELKHIILVLETTRLPCQGCDTVLPDQGYGAVQTAVTDEYGAMGER
jgi:hypothetical protein